MSKKKSDPLPEEIKQLVSADASSLIERVKASNLVQADRDFLVRLIGFVLTVRALLEKRNFSLKSLLRRMFGLKTERAPRNSDRGPRSDKDDEKLKGHGRKGRDDYPGAEKIECKHETLKPGDTCPECHVSKLDESEPGVAYRWTGQAPLVLKIYLLQRLLCQSCKTIFTAKVPGEDAPKPDGDQPARHPERQTDATANAMVVELRYDYGVPHNRLADLQASQGAPLPPANQWKMVLKVHGPAQQVHSALEEAAAQGSLFMNDDTHMRVLTLERGCEYEIKDGEAVEQRTAPTEPGPPPPKINTVQNGRKGTTSGIVSLSDGRKIALYYTGVRTAGKNLESILLKRKDGLSTPLQMCDAASVNVPKAFETILSNCLDHCRRKYHDIIKGFPDEVKFVLDSLRKIYEADAYAKDNGLSPEQRLAYHQEHSRPVMEALHAWAVSQMQTDLCRTSGLGRAIKYMLKHWKKLTAFLRVAGIPIANSEVERLLKRAIRHRKNSMQYMNLRGAQVGDVMMSLIQTCRLNGVNPFDYLTAIQRFEEHVKKTASEWLPWNYAETRAKLLGAAQPAGP